MIDFIKLRLPASYIQAFRNNGLEYKVTLEEESGEFLFAYSSFGPIRIYITSHMVELKGSIHKYWNWVNSNDVQNYNDFEIQSVCSAIDSLADNFSFNPQHAKVVNLEFAVNLNTTFSPDSFLRDSLINYKSKSPTRISDRRTQGLYKEFKYSEYYLKVYDKGLQYSLNNNLLRVELKLMKNRMTKKVGIDFLADLKEGRNYILMLNRLISVVNCMMIIDPYYLPIELGAKDREDFCKFSNPTFWDNMTSKNKRKYYKNRFKKLRNRLGIDSRRDEVLELVKTKGWSLIKHAPFSYLYQEGKRELIKKVIPKSYLTLNKLTKDYYISSIVYDRETCNRIVRQIIPLAIELELPIEINESSYILSLLNNEFTCSTGEISEPVWEWIKNQNQIRL